MCNQPPDIPVADTPPCQFCDLAVDLGMRASNPGRELFGYHLSYLMKRNPDLYQHLDTSQPPKEEHYYGLDFRLRDAPTMKTFLECSHQDQNPDRCREIVNALSDARVAELTDLAREAGSNFLVTVCEDVKKQRSSEAASQALQDLAKAKHPKEVMDKDARSAMAASEEEYEQMLRANPQVYEIFKKYREQWKTVSRTDYKSIVSRNAEFYDIKSYQDGWFKNRTQEEVAVRCLFVQIQNRILISVSDLDSAIDFSESQGKPFKYHRNRDGDYTDSEGKPITWLNGIKAVIDNYPVWERFSK